MDTTVTLGPLTLATPLVASSGTVGSIIEFTDTTDFTNYGAAVIKSVAPEPWEGRKPPRMAHVGDGMLNAIGIQNPGVDAFMAEYGSQFHEIPTQVWGSVVAHDIDGFATVVGAMGSDVFSAIEINLSCPNLDGTPFALDPGMSRAVVESVREVTTLPIGAKLTCDAQPITDVARAVRDAGADWVVVGNTVRGASIDITTRKPLLSSGAGGYSGSPIRPIAIAAVMELHTNLPDLPVVGCGGISHGDHVVEYLLAGATAVAVGSAHFADPRVAGRILKQLRRYCDDHEIGDVADLTGAYEPW